MVVVVVADNSGVLGWRDPLHRMRRRTRAVSGRQRRRLQQRGCSSGAALGRRYARLPAGTKRRLCSWRRHAGRGTPGGLLVAVVVERKWGRRRKRGVMVVICAGAVWGERMGVWDVGRPVMQR